jgi:hypothetical protein
MKKLEFLELCTNYMINPEIALEYQPLRDALANKDDKRIVEIFKNEF